MMDLTLREERVGYSRYLGFFLGVEGGESGACRLPSTFLVVFSIKLIISLFGGYSDNAVINIMGQLANSCRNSSSRSV